MSAHITPQQEHIPPPTSVTPTHHDSQASHPAFTPSAYLNTEAYTPSEGMYDTSNMTGMTVPQSTPMEYDIFNDFSYFLEPNSASTTASSLVPDMEYPQEDDRTPVVSTTQQPIPPQSYPAPPNMTPQNGLAGVSEPRQPLMSPFQPLQGSVAQGDLHSSAPVPIGQVYYAPYGLSQVPPGAFAFPPGAPPHLPPYVQTAQYPYYPQPLGQPFDMGQPRSQNGSPTSTMSSVSLSRSASTSSDMRPVRPKVKLSWDDKRRIVDLHRTNTSLRQEDIAKMYGVDRSTISKIIIAQHRWTQPQEVHAPALPKVAKTVGGRFPVIEGRMDIWMDEQIALGIEVRDNVARDKAKEIAREIGFPMERFKASAKWLDKYKERRKAAGKIASTPSPGSFTYYPFAASAPETAPSGLSRSQSAMTLSSSDSSGQEMYNPSPIHSNFAGTPQIITPQHIPLVRSETDLVQLGVTASQHRQRSQSSPHLPGEPGRQSPSSGKASRFVRPSPLGLQRQNSYHGSSPSPRRPAPLTRASTSQGGFARRSRPTSLAASAFGITPINNDGQPQSGSPLTSPTTASAGAMSRRTSDVALAPFTTSMGGMSISPSASDNADAALALPLTPITPAHRVAGNVLTNTDYADMTQTNGSETQPIAANQPHPLPFNTMPNKHYIAQHYAMPQGVAHDFGPVPQMPEPQTAWQ